MAFGGVVPTSASGVLKALLAAAVAVFLVELTGAGNFARGLATNARRAVGLGE